MNFIFYLSIWTNKTENTYVLYVMIYIYIDIDIDIDISFKPNIYDIYTYIYIYISLMSLSHFDSHFQNCNIFH